MSSLAAHRELRTPRLWLRPLAMGDAQDVFEYARDPKVLRYTTGTPPSEVSETIAFVRRRIDDSNGRAWAVRDAEDGPVIGIIELKSLSPNVTQLHYAMAASHWGRGLMTEAVRNVIEWTYTNHPTVTRIETTVMPENVGSARVLEKCGFERTAEIEQRWEKSPDPVRLWQYALEYPPALLGIPQQIRTDRLVVRCYMPDDATRLKEAIDSNLEHLRRWLPWAMREPSELHEIEERLTRFRMEFLAGRRFAFGIFDPVEGAQLGAIGLHSIGPRRTEIGYWLREDMSGRGYITEAARAITRIAFETGHVDAVEIHCDVANERSAAVAERLGYRYIETRHGDTKRPDGGPRDSLVWSMLSSGYVAGELR